MSNLFGSAGNGISLWGTGNSGQGGGGSGVTSTTIPSLNNQLVLYDGISGVDIKGATSSGRPLLTAGVLSVGPINLSTETTGLLPINKLALLTGSKTVTTDVAGNLASTKNLPTGDYVGTTDNQSLTNKVIADGSNTVRATELATSGLPVVFWSAAPPTNGQVLKATSSTTAAWANDSTSTDQIVGAGGTVSVANASYIQTIYPSSGMWKSFNSANYTTRIVQRAEYTVADNSTTSVYFLTPSTDIYPIGLGYAQCHYFRCRLLVLNTSMRGNIWEFTIGVTQTSSDVIVTADSDLQWKSRMAYWSNNVPNVNYIALTSCNFLLDAAELAAGYISVKVHNVSDNCKIVLETEKTSVKY